MRVLFLKDASNHVAVMWEVYDGQKWWTMEGPAKTLAAMVATGMEEMPIEIMKLDDETAAIVIEIDGVDYILTMARVPAQRARRARQ